MICIFKRSFLYLSVIMLIYTMNFGFSLKYKLFYTAILTRKFDLRSFFMSEKICKTNFQVKTLVQNVIFFTQQMYDKNRDLARVFLYRVEKQPFSLCLFSISQRHDFEFIEARRHIIQNTYSKSGAIILTLSIT